MRHCAICEKKRTKPPFVSLCIDLEIDMPLNPLSITRKRRIAGSGAKKRQARLRQPKRGGHSPLPCRVLNCNRDSGFRSKARLQDLEARWLRLERRRCTPSADSGRGACNTGPRSSAVYWDVEEATELSTEAEPP